jgi:hypothetical protein
MKLYKVYMCLEIVMGRINEYKLYEFNTVDPVISVIANDPDDACFKASSKLAKILLKQKKKNKKALNFVREILEDIKIKRVEECNEKGL